MIFTHAVIPGCDIRDTLRASGAVQSVGSHTEHHSQERFLGPCMKEASSPGSHGNLNQIVDCCELCLGELPQSD